MFEDRDPRSGLSRLSFRTWTVLLVLAVAVPLLLFGAVTLNWMARQHAATVARMQTDTALRLAAAVDNELHAWEAVLTALAQSHALQTGHFAEFYAEAKAVAAQHDGWIVLTDAAGQQHLNTLRPYGTPLPATSAPELLHTILAEGKPVVSDLVFGKVAQRWLIAVAVPVLRDGRVVYMLDMSFTPDRLTRLLDRQQLPPDWAVVVLDSRHQVVSRRPMAEDRIGKPTLPAFAAALQASDHGTLTGISPYGVPVRWTFNRLTEAPWFVSLSIPLAALPSPRPVYGFLALGVCLGCCAVAVALYASRKLVRPVTDLAARAEQILRGEVPEDRPPSGVREIQALEQALVTAATNAQALHEEQARVAVAEARATAEAEAAEALRASEQRYRSLVELAPEAVLVHQEGRIVYANAAALRLYGAEDTAQLIGADVLDLVHPDDRALVVGRIQQVVAGQTVPTRALRHRRLDGQAVSVETMAASIDWQGRVAVQAIVRDITERQQAEAALRLSEEKFAITFKSAPVGISIVSGASGRYLDANDTLCQLFGYTREEFLGRTGEDLRTFHRAADREQLLADGQRIGAVRGREMALVRKSGEVFPALLSLDRITVHGEPLFLGTVVDITAHKQAEAAVRQSEEKFAKAFAANPAAMTLTRVTDGRVMDVNDAYLRLLGYTRSEVIGCAVQDLGVWTTPDDRQRYLDTLHQGGRVRDWEVSLTGKTGQRCDILLSGELIRVQNAEVVLSTFLDVTARKQAEAALQLAKDELEQRVQARTADLAEKASQLQVLTAELTLAEQRERQRLAEVLHDGLQQLLVAAKFRVNLLPRTDPSRMAAWSQEMEHLLTEAIAASRTLTGELSPPILQAGGLVAGLEWLVRWKAEKYQLAVDLDADPQALPDSEAMTLLLFQSVRELLFNIVKHAQVQAARVEVRRQDGHLRIVVSDQGVGFDPAARSATSLGGLGLSSIRQRLEYLGGRVDVASAPGQGCRITLAAPLQSLASAPPTPVTLASADGRSAPSVARGRKTRILLVDDHAVVRQALAQMLGAEPDLEVVGEAGNGQEGVDLTKALQPDVVLMDISLPGLNGIDATQQIHADCPGVQVIGLSMFGDTEVNVDIRRAGAVAYLSKGAPAEEVLAAIRACAPSEAGSR